MTKPLFNARLLAEARGKTAPALELDDERQRLVANWAASAASGALLGQKEKPLQGQFLSEVLDRVLGYRLIVGPDQIHHQEPETSSKAVKGYRPPDARLGWYGPALDLTRAVLELKAPGADLDARQGAGYGRLTPVEQAFGYASKVDGCRWVLVGNFSELRLYRTDRGQGYCQRFFLADLADPDRLGDFLFLLSRPTLLGANPTGESPVERLASQTHSEEERITKGFYVFYRDLRLDLFHQLRRDNPPPAAVQATTRAMDRTAEQAANQVTELAMDQAANQAMDQAPDQDSAPANQAADKAADQAADQAAAHQDRLLELTQKLLDRCLFICFCEDTRLLPAKILAKALTAKTEGFVPVTRWQQLRGLFDAVDKGMPAMQINGYNGGLFARDPELDALRVSDESLDGIGALAGYDFETDLNVNILGHIFEQSITDLEAIRAAIRANTHGGTAERQLSRRKRDGIFYTPDLITRFMVARAIGGWLAARLAAIEARHRTGRPGPLATETRLRVWLDYLEVLGTIKILDLACGSGAFLVAAFDYLYAEYERVNRLIAELTGAPRQRGLFDLDRQILQENLYGVDLNPESVEITKLSLWLKTARRDKPLNNLDGTIRCGNSLVEPPGVDGPAALATAFAALPADARPFDWRAAFPEVFARGGFDVVIGNPPYVRQELLGGYKPYLAQRYATFSGVADLYVYFYERGLELLAPDGKLSYIVTNKWLRAGYGEPLRRYFVERAEIEEILDFGHAPIFEDADTFPCILVAHPRPPAPSHPAVESDPTNPTNQAAPSHPAVQAVPTASTVPTNPTDPSNPSDPSSTSGRTEPSDLFKPSDRSDPSDPRDPPHPSNSSHSSHTTDPYAAAAPSAAASAVPAPMVRICPIPRDRSGELSLENYVHEHSYDVPWSRYGAAPWSLEPPEVEVLMALIRERGVPLMEFVGAKPLYGIKTGLNEAFLIDDATRTALIRDDPGCAAIIKPYLRGQDIGRWVPDWRGLWMIVLRSSGNWAWPWSDAGEEAEAVFQRTYPSLHAHMKPLQDRLMARQDKGRYWWELRACDYYGAFDRPKLVYQVIQFHPQYALDSLGRYGNDKTFFLSTADPYLLAVLNSPLLWWHNWRYLPHMKDEALNPAGFRMEALPIAEPTPEIRIQTEERVAELLALTQEAQNQSRELLSWLRLELGVDQPGQRLETFADLSGDDFVAEVRKRRPKGAPRLSPKAIAELIQTHGEYAVPARERTVRVRALEHALADLVNRAYRLTAEEIDLLWRTAPPRMPRY